MHNNHWFVVYGQNNRMNQNRNQVARSLRSATCRPGLVILVVLRRICVCLPPRAGCHHGCRISTRAPHSWCWPCSQLLPRTQRQGDTLPSNYAQWHRGWSQLAWPPGAPTQQLTRLECEFGKPSSLHLRRPVSSHLSRRYSCCDKAMPISMNLVNGRRYRRKYCLYRYNSCVASEHLLRHGVFSIWRVLYNRRKKRREHTDHRLSPRDQSRNEDIRP